MCAESPCQKYWRIPRFASSVTTRSSPFPIVRTQTLRTPSRGARYASFVPSGEICGPARSGDPKRTSRGMRSTARGTLSLGGETDGEEDVPQDARTSEAARAKRRMESPGLERRGLYQFSEVP